MEVFFSLASVLHPTHVDAVQNNKGAKARLQKKHVALK